MHDERNLWQKLKEHVAQPVREDDALCEFDCRKLECAEDEWATCERRISKGAGELRPAPTPEIDPK